MFINALLKKYPQIRRPGGIFKIQNIFNGVKDDSEGEFSTINENVYNSLHSMPVKPPFRITWYEFEVAHAENQKLCYGIYCVDPIEFNEDIESFLN